MQNKVAAKAAATAKAVLLTEMKYHNAPVAKIPATNHVSCTSQSGIFFFMSIPSNVFAAPDAGVKRRRSRSP
jgi:hypothetical protein